MWKYTYISFKSHGHTSRLYLLNTAAGSSSLTTAGQCLSVATGSDTFHIHSISVVLYRHFLKSEHNCELNFRKYVTLSYYLLYLVDYPSVSPATGKVSLFRETIRHYSVHNKHGIPKRPSKHSVTILIITHTYFIIYPLKMHFLVLAIVLLPHHVQSRDKVKWYW